MNTLPNPQNGSARSPICRRWMLRKIGCRSVLLLGGALVLIQSVAEAVVVHGGGRRGAVVGEDRAVVAGPRGAVATGPRGTAVAGRPLPRGYVHAVPGAYRRVVYRGYNCYYANGVYYRPTTYQGQTVYVVVD